MSDCLYFRGKNMARRPLGERLEACLNCIEDANKDTSEIPFRLSMTPSWRVQDDDFWNMLEDDDDWSSVLFVPASLAIKTGAVQSTLFEHSSIDFKDVVSALTESIARPDLLDDCRGGPSSWASQVEQEEQQVADPDNGAVIQGEFDGAAVELLPGQSVVFLKTYKSTVVDGVGKAEEQKRQDEGQPAGSGEVAPAARVDAS